VEELIYVPPDAQYFAAMGAVFFGRETVARGEEDSRIYGGADRLEHYIAAGKELQLQSSGASKPGLVESEAEAREFIREYSIPSFSAKGRRSETIEGYLGIDGGSTSSKIAIIDAGGDLVYKDYVLSRGNPIVDVREMFRRLTAWLDDTGTSLNLLGAGVTGYASSILHQAFDLDLEIVETVAHMKSARSLYDDVDVICDVGGQDIKVLIIKHGRVVDIRLNTQCSAGNGYFLQSMAEQFGVPMEEYADRAFRVRRAPSFNYGCAVFMEQDKVNFQQLGWSKDEIMAGLALVLPLNIWNFVVQEANLRRLGTNFLLQGGTQRNLAAVKAQVDFIKSRVPGATVRCHKYADIAGAMGAAIEVRENAGDHRSTFVGLERAGQIEFKSINDESTVCRFCSGPAHHRLRMREGDVAGCREHARARERKAGAPGSQSQPGGGVVRGGLRTIRLREVAVRRDVGSEPYGRGNAAAAKPLRIRAVFQHVLPVSGGGEGRVQRLHL
jgi:activator of 2-hydroxyglutaryl-CoA dehydratase